METQGHRDRALGARPSIYLDDRHPPSSHPCPEELGQCRHKNYLFFFFFNFIARCCPGACSESAAGLGIQPKASWGAALQNQLGPRDGVCTRDHRGRSGSSVSSQLCPDPKLLNLAHPSPKARISTRVGAMPTCFPLRSLGSWKRKASCSSSAPRFWIPAQHSPVPGVCVLLLSTPRQADGAELRGRQLARLSRGSTEKQELAGALQPFRQARCAGPGLMDNPGVVQKAREESPPRRSDRVSCVS